MEGRPAVGRSVPEEGVELGAFGTEPIDASRGVGVEDFSFGGALVGEDAAVVDVGESGDVPGVGGVAAPALGGVAGVADEGGGAEEVDLGPGAALDAVDGAGPGVGAVGAAVVAVAL